MATHVVIEIRVDLGTGPLLGEQPTRPRPKPDLRIAAVVLTPRPVKPHIHERPPHPLLTCRGPAHVVEAECHSASLEHSHDIVRVPTRIAKLQNVAESCWKRLQELLQTFTVELPSRRQLIEDGAKMFSKDVHATEQSIERLGGIFQLLHVCEKATRLDAVKEALRRARRPGAEGAPFGKTVERVVDFEGVDPFMSDVLTLGVPDTDGAVILLAPDTEVPLGGKVF